jgi:putative oxidoreductase
MRYWNTWAPLPLRLVLGLGFMYHGFPKLLSTAGHDKVVNMLQSIGIPAPDTMAWVMALVEVGGGLALVLGAWVAISATLLTIDVLIAMWTVHLFHGFSATNITNATEASPMFGTPGYEVNLLYIAGLLALLLGGAGAWALDRPRSGKRVEVEEPSHAESVR